MTYMVTHSMPLEAQEGC